MNCHLRAGHRHILCGQHWLLHDKSYTFHVDNGILGRIPLNCLSGQLLLGLLFCRVYITLAKLSAGNYQNKSVEQSSRYHISGMRSMCKR